MENALLFRKKITDITATLKQGCEQEVEVKEGLNQVYFAKKGIRNIVTTNNFHHSLDSDVEILARNKLREQKRAVAEAQYREELRRQQQAKAAAAKS